MFLIVGALGASAADNAVSLRPPVAPAEPISRPIHSGRNLWFASVAALAVTNTMDVQSSWGKRELNTALAGQGGTFGVRGVLLKAGITAGVVGLEFLVMRHGPSAKLRRKLAAINFVDAGVVGTMAVRNWQVPSP